MPRRRSTRRSRRLLISVGVPLALLVAAGALVIVQADRAWAVASAGAGVAMLLLVAVWSLLGPGARSLVAVAPPGVAAEGRGSGAVAGFDGWLQEIAVEYSLAGRRRRTRCLVSDPARPAPFWVPLEQVGRLSRSSRVGAPEPAGAQGVRALGHVALMADASPAELKQQAARVDALCARCGWEFVKLVRDVHAEARRALDRPGLTFALDRLRARDETCLVVADLRHLFRSFAELGEVLAELDAAGARLVSLEPEIDTAAEPGRRTVDALVAVSGRRR